jgi:pimeloyl-ACP methyl ester carboxylesterase
MRLSIQGYELDWEVRGEGRPLVLVHGLTTDRRVLVEACEPALETLGGWRRIYVDLPGHGASRGDVQTSSADAWTSALAALVREAAPEGGAALLGYAYGGYLAQGMVNALSGLAGLFLLCPTVEPDLARRRVPPRRVAVDGGDLPFSDDPRERESFDEVAVVRTREVLERFQRVVHPAQIAVDRELVAAVRARYALSWPVGAALQAFAAPVTIVCGRNDHWVGFEDAVTLVRDFPDVQFVVLPGCGNLLPLEAPQAFAALLTDWLRRL